MSDNEMEPVDVEPMEQEESPEGDGLGVLVPQPHGGALWRGKPRMPKAGPGRPSEVIREASRNLLADKALPKLRAALDQATHPCPKCGHALDGPSISDLTKALNSLSRIGIPTKHEHDAGDGGQAIVILPAPQGE